MTQRATLLWVLCAVLTLPAVTTRIYASDEVQYFAFLRSLAFDGDLSFENEYQHFHQAGAGGAGFHETFLAERFTSAGRRINFGTIGPALLWAPFYAVGHLVAGLTGAPQDGYSQPYITAVAWASALYGWAALWLSAVIATRFFGRGLLGATVVLLGTPLLFYMFVAPPFSHACATFAVAAFLWVWLRVREHWTLSGIITLGLVGGLMGTMRDQTVLFMLPPALDFIRWAVRAPAPDAGGWARPAKLALAGTCATLLGYAPHLLASWAVNGYVGPHESVGNKMSWSSPHALGVLFSDAHGWLWWTPLAVFSLAGLVLMASGRSRPLATAADTTWVGVCAVLMVALQIYINGAVDSWTVAGAFGQRRFVELTPLLVLGLTAVMSLAHPPRRVWWGLFTLCVWWNVGLLLQFGTHRMDRQRLNLSDNAWVTFVDLPRQAPGLAWRYLTQRESFYRQPRQ